MVVQVFQDIDGDTFDDFCVEGWRFGKLMT